MLQAYDKIKLDADKISLTDGSLKIVQSWYKDFKKKGALEVPEESVSSFVTKFGCKGQFSKCIENISNFVKNYNSAFITFSNGYWQEKA